MKKVLLHYYNKVNLGDDLFIKILSSRYTNTFTLANISGNTFLESLPNITSGMYRIAHVALKVTGKLTGLRNLPLKVLATKHDVMVYIGGSIFIENNQLDKWEKELSYYRSLTIPYYILGSNFGPYQHDEFKNIIEQIIRKASDVCFRDFASYAIFKDIPTSRVATDVAFALNTKPFDIKDEKTAIFSLIDSTKKFDSITTEKYEEIVRTLTKRLIADNYKVIYMSFCKHEGDEVANNRVRAGLPADISSKIVEFNYHGNLDDALSLLARSEIIIASRFHATILGLVFGKKVLPMAYSDKTTDILTDMAFPGTVADIRKIDKFDPMTFDFNTIPIMDVAEQRALAETQFQELDKVLIKKATNG